MFGKGAWSQIARSYVQSRTPAQVASHAQKHFIRLQQLASGKVTKRASSRSSQSNMLASKTASVPSWKEQAESSNHRQSEQAQATASSGEKPFTLPPRLVIKNGTTISQQASRENSGETSLNPSSPANGNFSTNLPKGDKGIAQSGWDTSASCRLAQRMVGNGSQAKRQSSSQSAATVGIPNGAVPNHVPMNGQHPHGQPGKLPTTSSSKDLQPSSQKQNGNHTLPIARSTPSPSPSLSPSPPPSSIQTQAIPSSSSSLTNFNGHSSQQAQSSSTPYPHMPWAHLPQNCPPYVGPHAYNPYMWAYGWPLFPPRPSDPGKCLIL